VFGPRKRHTNDLYKKCQLGVDALLNEDGVNTLQFKLADKKPLTFSKGRPIQKFWQRYTVDLGSPESA
jgi:hypothetical protein